MADKVRILSLDGGGAKSFYTLGALQEIEKLAGTRLYTAISWVTASPTAPTLTQSARAVAERALITAVAAEPSFKELIGPSCSRCRLSS